MMMITNKAVIIYQDQKMETMKVAVNMTAEQRDTAEPPKSAWNTTV